LLDQHLIVETHAVVLRTAAAHRVLLRGAQARHGLARIEDPALGAGDRIDEAPRHRGGSREQRQEVQRSALAAEHRARWARNAEDDLLRRDAIAIGGLPVELYLRVELPEGLLDPGASAEHGGLARDAAAAHALRRRHEACRHISAAEVLSQRSLDLT